jgi:hypothetical protein
MGLLAAFLKRHLRPSAAADGDPAFAASGLPPAEIGKLLDWVAQGLPAPPPHAVKQAILRAYARRFGTRVLVETGTFRGDMVEAMKNDFDHVYSIELSPQLFARASARFRGDDRITLIEGDSGTALGRVLESLARPALFWLDGHWSAGVTARGAGNTPVREELAAIFSAADLPHVILIDDAREFSRDPEYPSIAELQDYVRTQRPHFGFYIDSDIIRIHPRV